MDHAEVKAYATNQYKIILGVLQYHTLTRVPETVRLDPDPDVDTVLRGGFEGGCGLALRRGWGVDLAFLGAERVSKQIRSTKYAAATPVHEIDLHGLRLLATGERKSRTMKQTPEISELPAPGEQLLSQQGPLAADESSGTTPDS